MIVILFVSTTFTSCYYKWENQYLLMRISIPISDKNNSSSREVIKISVAPYIIFKNINIFIKILILQFKNSDRWMDIINYYKSAEW